MDRLIFTEIKSMLTMPEVAEHYGYQPNNKGFISCPFHVGDKTPSLKLYPEDKGWYCFGCHEGGDVISFVARLFSLSQYEAAKLLNADFALHLESEHPAAIPKTIHQIDPITAFEQEVKTVSNNIMTILRILYCWEKDYSPSSIDEDISGKWLYAINSIPYLEDVLQRLFTGGIDGQLTALSEAKHWCLFINKTFA